MNKVNISKYLSFLGFLAALTSLISISMVFNEFKGISSDLLALELAIGTSGFAAFSKVYMSRLRERKLRQQRIFIMYNKKDVAEASRIVNHLRECGYNPWFDVDEIAPGQRWAQSIMKGISESAVALYLVSENIDRESGFLAEELKAALSTMRSHDELFSPIIPVRLDNSEMPLELRNIQWVDIRENEGLGQLEKGIRRVLGQSNTAPEGKHSQPRGL